MKRASYKEAVQWLAYNDDTNWLDDPYGAESVSTVLVADIFGVEIEKVTKDLRREIAKMGDRK